MSAAGDIVLAEVPCIFCGYNLHMQPAQGRCPECGAGVADSVRETLMARGREPLLRIADALTLAAALNIGLVLGFVIFILLMAMSSGALPLVFLFFAAITAYALLQVVAAGRTAAPRPGAEAGRRRGVILVSGLCFAGATLVPLYLMLVSLDHGRSEVPLILGAAVATALFPGLSVFAWMVCAEYARHCTAGGWRGLARWSVRLGACIALGAGVMECGFVGIMLGALGAYDALRDERVVEVAVGLSVCGGLLMLLAGTLAATILQFVLARRFRELAESVGANPVLTGPPPLSSALPAP